MKLDLLFLNDVHGYVEPHTELFYRNGEEFTETVGGYSRIATMINEVRSSNSNTLLFDGGDTFHGTLPIVETKGQSLLPILNKLAFNAVVGHWDFGYGPQKLKELLAQLNYPMLGINVYYTDGGLFFKPYLFLEVADVKIAVIGICSDIIGKTMPEKFSEGLTITTGEEELPNYIRQVKEEGADIIILLSHNGFPQDMYLLQKTEGIDICLSAHTHNRLYESVMVNKSIVIQCGCHGSFVGHLSLRVENKSITRHRYELKKVTQEILPDKEIEDIVHDVVSPYKSMKENIVGISGNILHRYNTLNSSLDDLLLSSIKYVTGTEISFSNGWRYGAPIAIGNISEWDLYNIIPMNPPVSTVDLTGQEIKNLLEKNLESTFSSDPLKQMGGYVKRCSGLRVNFRIENPKGYRIQEIYFGDKHLQPESTYKVAFVTSQGVPKKLGMNRENLPIRAVDAMIAYLKEFPVFTKHVDSFYLV